MTDILSFAFIQNALLASLLAAVACGVIGTLVVVNRMVFLAGGVAHAAYGGVGLAFFFGLPVLPCALGFTAVASSCMSWATVRRSDRSDTIIGLMWAAGMAFGIILLDLTPGYNVDLMSFLFGSILAVPAGDLWIMAGLDVFTLLVVLNYYNAFLSMSFDREFARARGIPVTFLHFLLPLLISLSIVMIIRVVGLILVIALLTVPAYLAERWSKSLGMMMLWATLLNLVFCLGGLAASYWFNLTSGATIIAFAVVFFCLALLAEKAVGIVKQS